MNVVAQLWRMVRQKGDSPAISEAKSATAEFRRVDAYSHRVLREKEASDWLARDRPIESDHFRDRKQA